MNRRTVAAALVAAAVLSSPAIAAEFRMSDYRAPTPDTVPGAATVGTERVREMANRGEAVLIDVYPAPPRPATLPPGAVWMPKARRTIPGAVWLPNVGYGALPDGMDRHFRDSLERLTRGDRGRPIVFFCEPDCWMSWNAALRAVGYGYHAVHYYPEGAGGWTAAGLPLEPAQPTRPELDEAP
ncbi:PQQ-dependent catabolism-associated CXXCW motif protein [Skermanella mucosa]|uniref:PQQ-dependent catabolism-associated CXXCW motif protein n=1 Tax=Skermanella mucosa TaxID=1789672 RepID=UPI001E4DA4E8|nr:PQQ-dependent catabolism-associated CXXCW motif protein [Skermanella mucosa]UEM19617.1 PQQ-dependent catabolism-associated CXXCW motif protein [Skermanella mucosa]